MVVVGVRPCCGVAHTELAEPQRCGNTRFKTHPNPQFYAHPRSAQEVGDKEPLRELEVPAITRCRLEAPSRLLRQKGETAAPAACSHQDGASSLLLVNLAMSCPWKSLCTVYIPSAGAADGFVLY